MWESVSQLACICSWTRFARRRLPGRPRRKQAQVLSSDYLTNIHMNVAVSPAEPTPEHGAGRAVLRATRKTRKAAHHIRKAKINICFSLSCSRSSCINISVDLTEKVAPNADTHAVLDPSIVRPIHVEPALLSFALFAPVPPPTLPPSSALNCEIRLNKSTISILL